MCDGGSFGFLLIWFISEYYDLGSYEHEEAITLCEM